MAFVHLHVHTEHSAQDGLSRISTLPAMVKDLGQTAVAMTDHGDLSGAWRFVKACKKAGVKPIVGIEAYMALTPEEEWIPWGPMVEPAGEHERADQEAYLAGVPLPFRPGVRFVHATRTVMDAESGKRKRNSNHHLTILARNQTGWRNLCTLYNDSQESIYYKPLIDLHLLRRAGRSTWHDDVKELRPDGAPGDGGLIVLTGCLGGPVASHVAAARGVDESGRVTWDESALGQARENLRHLIECVGAENVYVEVMEHGLGAEGYEHIKMLATLAKEAGVEIVATNDAHYMNECDHDRHDEWLAAGELARGNISSLADEGRWRFNGHGYWMRSEQEMLDLHRGSGGWERACANTAVVADRIDDDVIPDIGIRLPEFPVPDDVRTEWERLTEDEKGRHQDPAAYLLHREVVRGAVAKYGSPLSDELKARLLFEEQVITDAGISGYFLIVADVIEWARSDRGLPEPDFPLGRPGGKEPILVGLGRGSAAGSATAYTLDITRVEPLANGLLFERFLDPTRAGMPDVDIDFEAARRDEVFAYVALRYGVDRVARIGAFAGMKSKRAIKDAARLLGLVPLGEEMAKLVPLEGDEPMPFAGIYEEVRDKDGKPVECPQGKPFRELVDKSPDAQRILETARAFEAIVAGLGLHAAAVVIADEPLRTLLPMRVDKGRGGQRITLFDGKDIDDFGLLKLDALGIVNLDYVAKCAKFIEDRTGEVIDPTAAPHASLTDGIVPDPDAADERVAKAFALLRAGRTQSVFQLASSGITDLCMHVAPTSFEDLSALVALYRPGPMGAKMHERYARRKNGLEEVDYSIYTNDPAEQQVIASILNDTFGLVVYQESLMQLSQVVAGFDAAARNRLRKAFSKKIKTEMDAVRDLFIAGGLQELDLPDGTTKIAFSRSTLETLWVTFDASAKYLFNKCLTGDTVLSTGGHGSWTIGALYSRLYEEIDYPGPNCGRCGKPAKTRGLCLGCYAWHQKFHAKGRGLTLLSYDFADGRIRPKRVKDVHFNGVRPVFELALSDGKRVRATGNHRFLTPDGWTTVEAIRPGTELVVNGGYQKQEYVPSEIRTTVGPQLRTPGHKPWLSGEMNSGFVDGGFVALKEWTHRTSANKACAECGTTEGRLQRAHLDGNRTNNTAGNLAWMCVSHHKMHDYRNNGRRRRWEKGHQPALAQVISVTPVGEEPTYDVEMDDENHNFVANGIISHNSHSAAYGYLAYLTAYLKANYPVEYAAAVLAVEDKEERRQALIADTIADGIMVLPPDLNASGVGTAPDVTKERAVRFGLSEIRDVKSNAEVIVERRPEGGYVSLGEVVKLTKDETGKAGIPVTTVEALVESGALDVLGCKRLGQMLVARALIADPDIDVPDVEWGGLELANRQRHRLGFSVGMSALDLYAEEIAGFKPVVTGDEDDPEKNNTLMNPRTVDEVAEEKVAYAPVVGVLTRWAPFITKRTGKRMSRFTLQGRSHAIDGVVFPGTFERWEKHDLPAEGTLVSFAGELKARSSAEGDDEASTLEMFADSFETIEVPNDPVYSPDATTEVNMVLGMRLARHAALTPSRKQPELAAEPEPGPVVLAAPVADPEPAPEAPAPRPTLVPFRAPVGARVPMVTWDPDTCRFAGESASLAMTAQDQFLNAFYAWAFDVTARLDVLSPRPHGVVVRLHGDCACGQPVRAANLHERCSPVELVDVFVGDQDLFELVSFLSSGSDEEWVRVADSALFDMARDKMVTRYKTLVRLVLGDEVTQARVLQAGEMQLAAEG